MVHAVLVVNTPNMPSTVGTIKDLKSYVHYGNTDCGVFKQGVQNSIIANVLEYMKKPI